MNIPYSVGSLIVFSSQTKLQASRETWNNVTPYISLLDSAPEFPRARVTLMTLVIAVLINAVSASILWANTWQTHGCIHTTTASSFQWPDGRRENVQTLSTDENYIFFNKLTWGHGIHVLQLRSFTKKYTLILINHIVTWQELPVRRKKKISECPSHISQCSNLHKSRFEKKEIKFILFCSDFFIHRRICNGRHLQTAEICSINYFSVCS